MTTNHHNEQSQAKAVTTIANEFAESWCLPEEAEKELVTILNSRASAAAPQGDAVNEQACRDKAQEVVIAAERVLGERFNIAARHELVNQMIVAFSPVTAPVGTGEQPLCAVHKRLEDADALECEIGNGCVACSLNERRELLQLIAPFAAEGNTEDSVTVMRRVAEFYATHAGDGRVVVSYPAATSTPVDGCPEPNNDSTQATHSATGDVSA